jgi:peptide chain release factor subunit 1
MRRQSGGGMGMTAASREPEGEVIAGDDTRATFLDDGRRLLRAAAELSSPDRSVLTAYVDLSDGWDRAESVLDSRAAQVGRTLSKDEREALEVSVELVRERLAGYRAEGWRRPGLVVFVSLSHGSLVSLGLPRAPRPLVAVDDEAMVWQLALMLDGYEPVGVIVVDGSQARVLVAAGEISEEHPASRPQVRHLTKVGGWSQMRYQRRRDQDIRRAADELVVKAVEAFEEAGVGRVVPAGRDELMTAVEQRLPQRWSERVVGRIDWDLDAERRELLGEAHRAAERAERDQEQAALAGLVGELRRGGLAVSGVEDTRRALAWGAVKTLFLGPSCAVDVREELTSDAVTTSAQVEAIVEDGTPLDEAEGVAALLRFPVEY